MSKLNWVTKACGVFLLLAMTAIGLPAQTFTTLFSFNGTNGVNPEAALVQATDGNLYGTTSEGGASSDGTVFTITPSGTLTTIYNFCSLSNCTDGSGPEGGLVQATDGYFYGTTAGGGASGQYGTVFKITPGGTLTTLHSFDLTDGSTPVAALVQDTDEAFMGQRSLAGPTATGRSSKSRQVAC